MPQWLKAAGYLVISPALFDRIAPDITLVYDGDGVAEGRGLKDQADANNEFDVKAAIDRVAPAGAVAVVGFCWGGSLAWRMACEKASGLAAAISCYDAGHGFNCDYRGQHDADAAALAWGRTMAFFGNAFGLILAGDGMPNIIHYRCNQPLAKAVITCQA
jgi:dienelactone hydrolase